MSRQKFANHRGWELDSLDDTPPIADNGNIIITLDVESNDTIIIEGNGRDSRPVPFYVPIAVMRAWLQEYEKWKAHNDARPMP